MTELPTLEHATEQWLNWCWNLSLAIFQRGSQPGRSAEVTEHDVVQAMAPPVGQFMDRVQASSPDVASLMAEGLRIQASTLARQADYIGHWLGQEPGEPNG